MKLLSARAFMALIFQLLIIGHALATGKVPNPVVKGRREIAPDMLVALAKTAAEYAASDSRVNAAGVVERARSHYAAEPTWHLTSSKAGRANIANAEKHYAYRYLDPEDPQVCAAHQDGYYLHPMQGAPATCPVPIGTHGERMHRWVPGKRPPIQRVADFQADPTDPRSWFPWTHRPLCGRGSQYCVFSAATVPASGLGTDVTEGTDNGAFDIKGTAAQGISIITTPEMAAYRLHPHLYALHPGALRMFDWFAALPPAFEIKRIGLDEESGEFDKATDKKASKTAKGKTTTAAIDDDNDNENNDADDDDNAPDEAEVQGLGYNPKRHAKMMARKTTRQAANKRAQRFAEELARKLSSVKPTANKGMGAVAVRDIRASEAVLVDRPAILAHFKYVTDIDLEAFGTLEDHHGLGNEGNVHRARMWRAAVDQLAPATAHRIRHEMNVIPRYRETPTAPDPESSEYDDGHNDGHNDTANEDPFNKDKPQKEEFAMSQEEKVFASNAWMVNFGGFKFKALFPGVSKFNHDCKPNLVAHMTEIPMVMTVWARRDIKRGEELTLSYIPDLHSYEMRKKMLGQRFGFTCQCDMCTRSNDNGSGSAERAASDARRAELRALPLHIEAALKEKHPAKALEYALIARDIYTEEGVREPGTIAGGHHAGSHDADVVADAFGPEGFAALLARVLYANGDVRNALPHLRASLTENWWRAGGWQAPNAQWRDYQTHLLIEALAEDLEEDEMASALDLPQSIYDIDTMMKFHEDKEHDDDEDEVEEKEEGEDEGDWLFGDADDNDEEDGDEDEDM